MSKGKTTKNPYANLNSWRKPYTKMEGYPMKRPTSEIDYMKKAMNSLIKFRKQHKKIDVVLMGTMQPEAFNPLKEIMTTIEAKFVSNILDLIHPKPIPLMILGNAQDKEKTHCKKLAWRSYYPQKMIRSILETPILPQTIQSIFRDLEKIAKKQHTYLFVVWMMSGERYFRDIVKASHTERIKVCAMVKNGSIHTKVDIW